MCPCSRVCAYSRGGGGGGGRIIQLSCSGAALNTIKLQWGGAYSRGAFNLSIAVSSNSYIASKISEKTSRNISR